MKALYLKLQEKLFSQEAKDLFTNAGVKPVKEIDFYKQQYLAQELFESLSLPAVLVDFEILYDTDKKPAGANITLHCCYEVVRDTAGRKKVTGNNALKFFDFVNIVYCLVNKLESDTTGKLELVSENQEKNDSIIYTQLLGFKCSYTGRMIAAKDQFDFTDENSDLQTTGSNNKNYDF